MNDLHPAKPAPRHFNLTARVLHWSMALAILAMLFVGIGMVASLSLRPTLVSLHRPLGIAILLLAIVRLVNRLRHRPPPLPADLPRVQVLAAKASHWLLYALMFAMPLIGWSMLSAGGYPVTMFKGFNLPPIMPHDASVYAALRGAHTWLALLLFATVLLHLAAALFHAWVRRDEVFPSMARGASPTPASAAPEPTSVSARDEGGDADS
ncbi:Cytochrome b561 protein [Rhodanobacter sp. Root179]|uniref:cytochrome b n=1 Tax=Rhodanobacter sp. Root179 TaxID=1736482 RepID=UPI0007011F9D|nr:cytochrome b [Rhodanobacter sp. Root179]KRB40759.1 cytochrome B [Rhodanobacter sp. Root179]